MRLLFVLIFIFSANCIKAQEEIKYSGKQFFAVSARNTDSTSAWYERVFRVKLLKEIKPGNGIHVRILGNEHVMIEIAQPIRSGTIEYPGAEKDRFTIPGYFKIGFYVADIVLAEKYFRGKNVNILHGPFDDKETNSRSFIMEDINGDMIQVLEEKK
jgi:hypothetical protein